MSEVLSTSVQHWIELQMVKKMKTTHKGERLPWALIAIEKALASSGVTANVGSAAVGVKKNVLELHSSLPVVSSRAVYL